MRNPVLLGFLFLASIAAPVRAQEAGAGLPQAEADEPQPAALKAAAVDPPPPTPPSFDDMRRVVESAHAERLTRMIAHDTDLLRARGERRRSTGIALVTLGALNLTVAVGAGIGLATSCGHAQGLECEWLGAALFGTAIASGIVASALLTSGIPLVVYGQREVKRAAALEAGLSTDWQRGWTPSELAGARDKRKWTGLGLTLSGVVNLALGLASMGALFGCMGSSNACSTEGVLAALPMAVIGGTSGVVLLASGGHLYRTRNHPAADQLSLRLNLGSTVGLKATF
jgi:hypothetical protein